MKNSILAAVAGLSISIGTLVEAQDWSGLYAGGSFSAGTTGFDWALPFGSQVSNNFGNSGVSVFAGYNWQNGSMVYGAEAQASLLNGSGTFSPIPGPGSAVAQIDRTIELRGRVGFASGNVLSYAFLGAVNGSAEINAVGTSIQNETHTGVSMGVGVDYRVRENRFVRVELSQTRLNTKRYSFCSPGCLADISLNRSALNVGYGMEF